MLDDKVRRVRNEWDWEHILQHCQLRREYKRAFKRKLRDPKNIPADLATSLEVGDTCIISVNANLCGHPVFARLLQYYEKQLDVFNIVIARQQAQVEVSRRFPVRLVRIDPHSC